MPRADLGLAADEVDVEPPETELWGEELDARLTHEKLALVLYGALDALARPMREREGDDEMRWRPRRSRGRVFFLAAGASAAGMAGEAAAVVGVPGVPGVSVMAIRESTRVVGSASRENGAGV